MIESTPPPVQNEVSGFDEWAAIARTYEPERYLAATLAPEPQRSSLIALAAYAGDLARIAATATQPMLGEIRLQWWRDSFDVIGKGGRIGSPLADALAGAIQAHQLPLPMLVAMSEARAWDLYDDAMQDQAALDGYLAKIDAIPFELALRTMGMPARDAGRLSLPAGRLWGQVRLLAQLPAHLSAGRIPLTAARLSTYGVTSDVLLAGTMTPDVRVMITGLTDELAQNFASLRPQLRSLSRHHRIAVLPLAVIPAYLRAIQRRSRDPLRDIAALAPMVRVWRSARGHAFGWF